MGIPIWVTDLFNAFNGLPNLPIKFKSLEIRDKEMIISAGGTQNKAMLFGRNKMRFLELKKIVEDLFGLELKII